VVQQIKSAENCSQVVRLCREVLGMPMVGIGGEDIAAGSRQATLSLMWQLMRHHTMRQLAGPAPSGSLPQALAATAAAGAVTEQDLLDWCNGRLAAAGKGAKLRSFADPQLATCLPLVELLECVAPGCIERDYLEEGRTPEQRRSNASYVVSSARKLGCTLYLATEDLAEVRPRAVLLLLAALMRVDRGGAARASGR
jgi:plastin-1